MRVKTDAKRQAILDAAGAVFRERGFGGASMSQVAERIGGSKATLYRYFSSKEDLFLATMLDAAIETAREAFDGLDPAKDPRRSLERFGAAHLAVVLSPANLAVRRILIAEGQRSGAGQRLYERGPKVTWSRLARYLEALMAHGVLPGRSGRRPCTCAACWKPTSSTAP